MISQGTGGPQPCLGFVVHLGRRGSSAGWRAAGPGRRATWRHHALALALSPPAWECFAGTWIGGLCTLAAEALVLTRADGDTRGALLQWVATSPAPLRRLVVEHVPASSADAALADLQAKPGLQVFECHSGGPLLWVPPVEEL